MDGAEIVRAHGRETRRRFCADGVPVLIAARNEEGDLPATLLSISASSVRVAPYVVVNGTTDATAERAAAMGAQVLHSKWGFKMAALQLAVRRLGSANRGPILFTDADTLVGPRWAESLSATCRAQARPVVTLGNSVFSHGESRTADLVRTARKIAVAQSRRVRGLRPPAHGHNMAIDFAGSAAALGAYLDIDPARFIGEEEEIVDRILGVGGLWRSALGADVTVATRGDRFDVRDLWLLRHDADFSLRRQRYPEYDGIKPFGGVANVRPHAPSAGGKTRPR